MRHIAHFHLSLIFTGQEEYFACHPLFLSPGALSLIIFDLSSLDLSSSSSQLPWQVEIWCLSIQCQDSLARVILVGSETGKLSKQQLEQSTEFMAQVSLIGEHRRHDSTFPQCVGWIPVSGTRGTQTDKLKKIIVDVRYGRCCPI